MSRLIQQETGENFIDLHTRMKIDKAKELLEPFWDRNQALILSVLHILSESETTYAYVYEDFSSRDNTKFIVGQEVC